MESSLFMSITLRVAVPPPFLIADASSGKTAASQIAAYCSFLMNEISFCSFIPVFQNILEGSN